MKTKTERYQFSRLSNDARERLVEELTQWAFAVWHSKAADLRDYWLEQKSHETIIYVLRTEDGRMVGRTTIKFYQVEYEGRSIVIGKLGLGVYPEHRGNKFALRCMISELLRRKAAHPVQPLYLFSTLIHPVTYKLCCDLLGDRLYPYFKNPVDPERQKLVEHLADQFGVKKADSPHPFVYTERFSAVETQADIDYWRNNPRPEVRFYVEHCPMYHCSSDCLIGLARINLPYVLTHMLRTLARNRVDKWRGRKSRLAS
jgi:hypothetical protein